MEGRVLMGGGVGEGGGVIVGSTNVTNVTTHAVVLSQR